MKNALIILVLLFPSIVALSLEPDFEVRNGAKGVLIFSYNYQQDMLVNDSKWLYKKVKCNKNGKLTEEIIYSEGATDFTKTLWNYDENSNLIEETHFNYDGSITHNIKKKYDSFGNLIFKHGILGDISEEKQLLEYKNNKITYEILEIKNKQFGESNQNINIKKYLYDNNDLLIKSIEYSNNDSTATEYFYEWNKLVKSIIYYDINKYTTELTDYNADGKINSTTTLNYKNLPINKLTNTYLDSFYVKKYYSYYNEKEGLITSTKYDYKDNMIEDCSYDFDGKIEKIKKVTYDSNGNILETYLAMGKKVLHRSQNKYDDKNSLIEIIFYDKANHPSKKLEFIYEFWLLITLIAKKKSTYSVDSFYDESHNFFS